MAKRMPAGIVPGLAVGSRWAMEFRVADSQEWVLHPNRNTVTVTHIDLDGGEVHYRGDWGPAIIRKPIETWSGEGSAMYAPYDRMRMTIQLTS